MELTHCHKKNLEIAARVQASYKRDESQVILKSLSENDLQEIIEGKTMEGKLFAKSAVESFCKETIASENEERLTKSEAELAPLELITIAKGNETYQIYGEVRDIEKGVYSDNALNQKLERVGKPYISAGKSK